MEEKTTVVIDIQFDNEKVVNELAAVNREMAALKNENAQLRKDVKDGTKTWEDVSKQLAVNEDRLRQLKASQSALSTQVGASTRKNMEYGSTLKEQASLLAELKRRYQSLDETQRNSSGGQKMLKEIQYLDDKIKQADYSQGNFQRNVGNYPQLMGSVSSAFGGASSSANIFGKAIMGLKSGNPVIAGITTAVAALGAAVKRLTEEFKDNEKAQREMNVTMAATRAETVANKRAWNDVADWFNTKWRNTVDRLVYMNYQIHSSFDSLVNFFGGDSRTGELYAKGQIFFRKAAEAQNQLIDDQRKLKVEEAKIANEVAALRAKAADKEAYDAQQRLDFLNQAAAKEEYIAKQRKNVAEREYKLLEINSKLAENSKEENDQLVEAKVKVIQADTDYQNTLRRLNRERTAAIREINGQTKATKDLKDAVDEVREAVETIDMQTYDQSLDTAAKKNKALADSIQKVADRLGALKTEMEGLRDSDIAADMKEAAESVTESAEDAPSKLEELAAAFQNNAKTIEATAESLGSSFGSLSDIYQQLAEDESKSEEEREAAARKAKSWAKIQIAANAGTAIAKGIAGAMDVPTFAGKIGALATVISSLLAAIAQAKALAAEGFYTGGVVGGAFRGATMGQDDTVINARRGEMVINAKQQKQLYDIANGGAASSLTASLIAAIQAMPAPVLEYSEFARFRDRIVTLNETQKLR